MAFEDASVGCEGKRAHVLDEQAANRQGDRVEVASYMRGGAVEWNSGGKARSLGGCRAWSWRYPECPSLQAYQYGAIGREGCWQLSLWEAVREHKLQGFSRRAVLRERRTMLNQEMKNRDY